MTTIRFASAPVGVPVALQVQLHAYTALGCVDRGCDAAARILHGWHRECRGRMGSGGSNTRGATGAGGQQSELHGGCQTVTAMVVRLPRWTRFSSGGVASTGGAVATGGAASATGGSPAVRWKPPTGGSVSTGGASLATVEELQAAPMRRVVRQPPRWKISGGGASTTGGATTRGGASQTTGGNRQPVAWRIRVVRRTQVGLRQLAAPQAQAARRYRLTCAQSLRLGSGRQRVASSALECRGAVRTVHEHGGPPRAGPLRSIAARHRSRLLSTAQSRRVNRPVVDGAGLVTLDGGARIKSSSARRTNTLSVRNLTFHQRQGSVGIGCNGHRRRRVREICGVKWKVIGLQFKKTRPLAAGGAVAVWTGSLSNYRPPVASRAPSGTGAVYSFYTANGRQIPSSRAILRFCKVGYGDGGAIGTDVRRVNTDQSAARSDLWHADPQQPGQWKRWRRLHLDVSARSVIIDRSTIESNNVVKNAAAKAPIAVRCELATAPSLSRTRASYRTPASERRRALPRLRAHPATITTPRSTANKNTAGWGGRSSATSSGQISMDNVTFASN